MDIKNKIEEILLTDYQYVDCYTIDKLLDLFTVSGSLPSKDEVVDKGYTKAKNGDYNYRRSLRDLDHDLYFSGWMDCYDWLSGNDH